MDRESLQTLHDQNTYKLNREHYRTIDLKSQ